MLNLVKVGMGNSIVPHISKVIRTCMNLEGVDISEGDIALLLVTKEKLSMALTSLSKQEYDLFSDTLASISYMSSMVENKAYSPNHNILTALSHIYLRSDVSNNNYFSENYLQTLDPIKGICKEFTLDMQKNPSSKAEDIAYSIYNSVIDREFFVRGNKALAYLMMNGYLLSQGYLLVSEEKITAQEFISEMQMSLLDLTVFS